MLTSPPRVKREMIGKFTFLLRVSFSAESSRFLTSQAFSWWKIIASSFDEDYLFLSVFVLIGVVMKEAQGWGFLL